MPITIESTNGPFLKHINAQRTAHLIVTAEDNDFDEVILENFRNEGFNVHYVPMKGENYAERVHTRANHMTGVNEYYAVVGMFVQTLKLHD